MRRPQDLAIGPTGRLLTSSASVLPTDPVSAGFAFDSAGAVKVVLAAPETYANGFGFWGGALCVGSGPVATYNSGLPFNALGQLITDAAGAITRYESGWPMTATGVAVSTAGVAPVISFELREDSGFELREDGGKELRER